MAPRDQYSPVPTVAPKDIATPSIHITTPDVHFTEAIGQAMGELGRGFGVLGGAQREVGAALGSAGKMLEGVGSEVFARAQALQEVQNQTEENQLRTKYDIESGTLFAQYEAKKGEDATGSYNAFVEGQKKLREDYKAKASNPAVARAFDNATMQTMGRTIFSAARHSATEQKSVTVQASSARIAQENINIEKNYKNDDQYIQSLDTIRTEIRRQGHVLGQPAAAVEVRVQEAVNDAALARINGMSREKPFDALKLFDKMYETKDVFGPKAEQMHYTLSRRASEAAENASSDFATRDLRSDHPNEDRTLEERDKETLERYRAAIENNPEGEARAISETHRKWNLWHTANEQHQRDAISRMTAGATGQLTDGHLPRNMDAFKAIPGMEALYDSLSRDKQRAVRKMVENADYPRTDITEARFAKIQGLALQDPHRFMDMDFTKEELPYVNRQWINNEQLRMRKEGIKLESNPQVSHAYNIARSMNYIDKDLIKNPNSDRALHFHGVFGNGIIAAQAAKGYERPLTSDEIRDVARTAQDQISYHRFGETIRGMGQEPRYQQLYEEIPDNYRQEIVKKYPDANETEIRDRYIRALMAVEWNKHHAKP